MIRLEHIYVLMGVLTAGVALVNVVDASNPKRWKNALFWGMWATTFLAGSHVPHVVAGALVLGMALVAGIGGLGQGKQETSTAEQRAASARRWGNRLFAAALVVPAVTLLGSLTLKRARVSGAPLVDPAQVTLVSLGIATVAALIVAVVMLRPPARAPLWEARRLFDAVGWAAVLPQMLAALGALFALAGVGQVVAELLGRWVPLDHPFAAVATYTVGMALFTMAMGNAFAAFPVMTAAIGLPVIVHRFGGDPTVMAAIGMLSGFCGTLMTPMAANFNIVPVALLELPDQHAVIRVQLPTALVLLAANTALMYGLVFR